MKMKVVMREVKHFTRIKDIWLKACWTPPAVTKMWSTIWPHIELNLRTLTQHNNGKITDEKSHQG